MEKEKAIKNFMEMLEISREDAEQLWEDDKNDQIGEEGEEMTKKAKEVVKTIHKASEVNIQKKEKKKVVKKENPLKEEVYDKIYQMLLADYGNAEKTNPGKLIECQIMGETIKVDIIQKRKK